MPLSNNNKNIVTESFNWLYYYHDILINAFQCE